jgi:hypothetical protein
MLFGGMTRLTAAMPVPPSATSSAIEAMISAGEGRRFRKRGTLSLLSLVDAGRV